MRYRYISDISKVVLIFTSIICITACVDKVDIDGRQIIFTSDTEVFVSRASFINTTSDISEFKVWGNYDGKEVFTGQDIIRVNNIWEYSPLQKWILSANQYDFSAYTPLSAGTPNINDNTLVSVDVDCMSTQEDLLLAHTTVGKADIGKNVLMTFKHALSAVSFSFKLNDSFSYLNNYRFISVKWDDVYTKGRFALNSSNEIIPTPMGNTGTTESMIGNSDNQLSTSSHVETDYQFVIPQNTMATLIVNIDINGEQREISKTLEVNWESGIRYTYWITIDPFEITIETTPWDVPDIEDIVVQ